MLLTFIIEHVDDLSLEAYETANEFVIRAMLFTNTSLPLDVSFSGLKLSFDAITDTPHEVLHNFTDNNIQQCISLLY